MDLHESERIRTVVGVLERYRAYLDLAEEGSLVPIARTLLAALPKATPPELPLVEVTTEACQVLVRATIRRDPESYLRSVFRQKAQAYIDQADRARATPTKGTAAASQDDPPTYDPSHDLAEIDRTPRALAALDEQYRAAARTARVAPREIARVLSDPTSPLATRPSSDFVSPRPARPFPPPRPAWYPPRPTKPRDPDDEPEPRRGELLDGGLFSVGDVLGPRVDAMREATREDT